MLEVLRFLIVYPILLCICRTKTAEAVVLSEEQIATFERDGYVLVKGLLLNKHVNDLAEAVATAAAASPKQPGYFSSVHFGAIFSSNNTAAAYREVALYSQLPAAVAQLMKLNAEHENIRVLRYVPLDGVGTRALASLLARFLIIAPLLQSFLAPLTFSVLFECRSDVAMVRDVQDMKTCDWHVDDIGFWPVSYLDEAGINVWIALDDMPFEGSMAVAPGSHRAAWRHDAYAALGQNRSRDGGQTKEEIRQNMVENKNNYYLTCDMHLANPDMYQKIEETAVRLDNVRKGDVLFASRLLFHRTIAVTPEGTEYYAKQQQQTLKRYSIRYEPGTAKINSGWNVEWSVLHDASNTGLSLDEIAARHPKYVFYPQVWPVTTDEASTNRVVEHAAEWAVQAKQQVYETLFGGTAATTNGMTIQQTEKYGTH